MNPRMNSSDARPLTNVPADRCGGGEEGRLAGDARWGGVGSWGVSCPQAEQDLCLGVAGDGVRVAADRTGGAGLDSDVDLARAGHP